PRVGRPAGPGLPVPPDPRRGGGRVRPGGGPDRGPARRAGDPAVQGPVAEGAVADPRARAAGGCAPPGADSGGGGGGPPGWREVLARLVRGEFELVDEREIAYYRNVFDHLVRYTELIEAAREMVSDLMQTHLSAASNRLNQVMKTLTMISTVVLPMSLIAGIYGMNFAESVWPPFDSTWGFWYAMGLMVFTGVLAFSLFRWRRWSWVDC